MIINRNKKFIVMLLINFGDDTCRSVSPCCCCCCTQCSPTLLLVVAPTAAGFNYMRCESLFVGKPLASPHNDAQPASICAQGTL